MVKMLNGMAFIAIILFMSSAIRAEQDTSGGVPPAPVVTAIVSSGMVTPEREFIATVYYREVSAVAAEVSGKVETVAFEEGQRVKAGRILVNLGSELLEKTLQATRASYEQILSDLKKAEKELRRSEELYKENLLSEESYDDKKFNVKSLEKQSAALRANVERLETEMSKKSIRAPFDGIVIERHVDRGEWLDTGSTVATIADDAYIDIVAEVPASIVSHIKQDAEVKASAGGKILYGKVTALIPRGNVSTRTFPVKVRAENKFSLKEGMEARVTLPAGKKEKTLTVPRDAVITVFGNTVVYTVNDSQASMIPVSVSGYKGMSAGVHGEGLKEGMKVVIKGNERLRPGQAVMIQK